MVRDTTSFRFALMLTLVTVLVASVAACGDSTTTFEVTLSNIAMPGSIHTSADGDRDVLFAPGDWAVLDMGAVFFDDGMLASDALRSVAEDGDNTPLARELAHFADATSFGTFGATDAATAYEEHPIGPGVSVTLTFDAVPGQAWSFASMYAQSNDSFIGPRGGALTLFDTSAAPVTGDVTDRMGIFDAGTEVNEEPGAGPNQAARQTEKGAGVDESLPIEMIEGTDRSGYPYAPLATMLRVELRVVD